MEYNYMVVFFNTGPLGICSSGIHSLEETYKDAVSSMADAYEYSDVVQIYRISETADQLGDF